MRRNLSFWGTLFLVGGLSFVLIVGCCPPKAAVKEEAAAPAAAASAVAPAPTPAPATAATPAPAVAEEKAIAPVVVGVPKLGMIYFDFDKYALRAEDREILKKHAEWLKANPGYDLSIQGFCDERGTDQYNMALGQRRADSAMKYLVSLGVDPKRLTTVSFGKEKPLDPAHNEDAWAKNRRCEFIAKGK
jgi:peptidoglycan-associated lipoprotein